MYNDYYLQQIDNKLATTNNNLEDIINNQELIIQELIEIESGDKAEREQLKEINATSLGILIILFLTLVYTFIVRCLR